MVIVCYGEVSFIFSSFPFFRLNNRSDYRQHYPFLYNLLCRMDTLRLELNKACDLRSEHTQTHLAVYPGGGSRYVRCYGIHTTISLSI